MDLTFAEIKARVARLGQWTDSSFDANIEDAVQDAYQEVINAANWKAMIETDESLTLTTGERVFAFHQLVDKVLSVTDRETNKAVPIVAVADLEERSVGVADGSGAPRFLALLAVKGVSANPATSGNVLSIASSDSGDTSTTVFIRGSASNAMVEESVTTNGTSTVTTTNTFDKVFKVDKSGDTDGNITVSDSDGNAISVLSPKSRTAFYQWAVLDRGPDSNRTIYVTYKRKFFGLTNDVETPILPEAGEVITGGAFYRVLQQQRKYSSAMQVRNIFKDNLHDYIKARKEAATQKTFSPNPAWLAQR